MAARGSRLTYASRSPEPPRTVAIDGVTRLWLTLVFRQGHPRKLAFRMLVD